MAAESFQMSRHLKNVGVPKLYRAAQLTDFTFEIPPVNDSGLFLTGPVGTGKTHHAAAILVDRLPDLMKWRYIWHCSQTEREDNLDRPYDEKYVTSYNAAFVCVPALLLTLRGTFDKGTESTEERILNGLIEHQLLVLDDFGAEKQTEWALQTLYAVLSARINDCRPTIITSNLSLTELHRIDPRLASRLGGMVYFKMEGDDRRIEARKKDRRAEDH